MSILVPIFNVEIFLARCINSLLEQTYVNIEYILLDDASTDNSLKVLNEIIDRSSRKDAVTIIKNDKNEGIVASRNKLLEYATGDYILFVDSDDYINLNMIERMLSAAIISNADIVGCDYIEEYSTGAQVYYSQQYPQTHEKWMKSITRLDIKGVLWKLLIRRSLISNNNLRFDTELRTAEDYLFCCQTFYYAKCVSSVKEAFYHYVKYNPQSVTQNTPQNINYQATAVCKVEDFYNKKGILKQLREDINVRKFILKLPYLTDERCFNPKSWKKLFPESNSVLERLSLPKPLKVKIKLAQTPLYWVLYLL